MATAKKFWPWFDKANEDRVYSNSGTRVIPVYSGFYDDKGILQIEQVGTDDMVDYIQSFAESVDLNVILARFQNGDPSALQKVQGFYGDVTGLPENMPDLLNKLNNAEELFNRLPVEFKEKYGNDFAQFICTFEPEQLKQVIENPQNVNIAVDKDMDAKELKIDE